MYEETLRCLDLFQLGKRRLRGRPYDGLTSSQGSRETGTDLSSDSGKRMARSCIRGCSGLVLGSSSSAESGQVPEQAPPDSDHVTKPARVQVSGQCS